MKLMTIVPALLLLTAAGPAPDSETKEDVRCFVAFSLLSSDADEEVVEGGVMAAQYFLGRLDGRTPGLDLEAAVTQAGEGMDEAAHAALLESCGKTFQDRNNEVAKMGEQAEQPAG
jgi:hypothetical protein